MRPAMKMALAQTRRQEPEGRRDKRGRYAPRNGYDEDREPWYDRYPEVEDRYREPEYRYEDMPEGRHDAWRIERVRDYDRYDRGTGYRHEEGARMIGFAGGDEMRNDYRTDGRYEPRNEMEHQKSQKQAGYAYSNRKTMDRETAWEWVDSMENEDHSRGPHFTMEQAKAIMKQKGWQLDPVEFWVAMNAVWSDGVQTARKHGVDNEDYWSDRAKDFLCDKDAWPDKLERYYRYIVMR